MEITDSILWNRLRKGDKKAHNEIFTSYVKVLYNYGKKITLDSVLVEDCIQDLFTDLWIKRNSLGSTNLIKPYLLISIKRRLLRQLSKEKSMISLDGVRDFYLEYSFDDEINENKGNQNNITILKSTVEKLTPKQKEVIYLKFYEQLSYVEIAKLMDVDIKAIYKLVGRAISNLRKNIVYFLFLCNVTHFLN